MIELFEKSMNTLELPRVLDMLAGEAVTDEGKELCRAAPRTTLEQQLELEAQCMVRAQETAESREGIGAFLEKRAPRFGA